MAFFIKIILFINVSKISDQSIIDDSSFNILDYQYFCQWYVTSTFLLDIQHF